MTHRSDVYYNFSTTVLAEDCCADLYAASHDQAVRAPGAREADFTPAPDRAAGRRAGLAPAGRVPDLGIQGGVEPDGAGDGVPGVAARALEPPVRRHLGRAEREQHGGNRQGAKRGAASRPLQSPLGKRPWRAAGAGDPRRRTAGIRRRPRLQSFLPGHRLPWRVRSTDL